MELLASSVSNEVGLKVLLSPLGSNVVARTACCAVGIGLPVYFTFKAIENKDKTEQEKWLIYWAVYGSFSLVEVFSDKILSWFPFYYHMKLAFLVWLQLPSNNGSKQLYTKYLRKFLVRHQAKMDRVLDVLSSEINKFISDHQGEIQFFKAMAVRCAMTANQMVNETTTQPAQISRQGAEHSNSETDN